MTPRLSQFVATYSKRVNQQLQNALPARVPGGEQLLEAMAYSLLNGGKRIRPILVYASAQANGQSPDTPLVDAGACAVELMHAYSLIHDDLPSMDDDDLRRGKPSCHIAYGEATAILAGDALQALAFEVLACAAGPATSALALIQELSRAAGPTGMVAGQAIDLASVNTRLALDQLEHMHNHKTGALIEASVVMGMLATGEHDLGRLRKLRRYAKAIGLSFQVQDDILDVITDTQTLGKRQGADQRHNKPTYVTLLGLEGAQAKAQALHENALEALEDFGAEGDILRDLSAYIVARNT